MVQIYMSYHMDIHVTFVEQEMEIESIEQNV